MAYTAPVVSYSTTMGSGFINLTGIQSVVINRGRQRFQDNFTGSQMTVELIPANSYATPIAVGQYIRVEDNSSPLANRFFDGQITDVNRTYAMPYNSGTGYAPGDRITITATGATGLLGKSVGNTFTLYSASDSRYVAELICNTNNVFTTTTYDFPLTAQTQGGTYSNYQALDLLNTVSRTGQIYFDDYGNASVLMVLIMPSGGIAERSAVFVDDSTTGANVYKFNQIEFQSSVQTSFTQVAVTANGLATQYASNGSAPYTTLNYSTLNTNTTDAQNLANYVLSMNQTASATPFSISTNTFVSPTCVQIAQLPYGTSTLNCAIGSQVTTKFRGTTSYAQIQGISSSFYPDHASVQVFLSPSLGTPFTLDSSAFGVLDQNRLGYP